MIGIPKASGGRVHGGPAVATGMRRVSWVKIDLDGADVRCELLGVGHRLPCARRVSLDTALALAAAGVPTVVRSADGAEKLLPTG